MGHVKTGLAHLRRVTGRKEATRRVWLNAIREAHAYGCSLRDIGEAAGISHTRVVQILRELD